MRAKETLRIGIVGCGGVAQRHISALLKNKYAKLVSVCDANEDLARQTALRFKINNYYHDLSELLLKEQVDVVHVTTPPRTHAALSMQAIESGCHVLVEKPMFLNLNEADMAMEAARSNKVMLCVVHNFLFQPVVIRARSIIEEGMVGDLTGLNIVHSLRPDSILFNREHWCHKLPGGLFGEMLPHSLYLATAFLGRLEVASVYCRKLSNLDWLAADELRIILEGNNSVATIVVSANGLRSNLILDVFGTKAFLHTNIPNGIAIRTTARQLNRFSGGSENMRTAYQWVAGTGSAALSMMLRRFHDGHYNLTERFVDSLRNGTDPPVTVEDAREVVRLYEAITSQI